MNTSEIARAYAETCKLPEHLNEMQLAQVWVKLGEFAWTSRGLRLANKWLAFVEQTDKSVLRENAASLAIRMAMFACQYGGDVSPQFYLPPCDNPSTRYSLALIVAFGSGLSREEIQFVMPANTDGLVSIVSGPRRLSKEPGIGDNLAWLIGKRQSRSAVDVPDELKIERHAVELAHAFTSKMISEAKVCNRPPLVGKFIMNPPQVLGVLHQLGFEHLRLIIKSDGIWCTAVYEDGKITPGYWSPSNGDNLAVTFGLKATWAFRVFLSCLWRDATVTRTHSFRVKRIGRNKPRQTHKKQRVIVLPRTVRTMEWGDQEFGAYYSGEMHRAGYTVQEQYRRLPAGHMASDSALQNACDYGYPEPPDGFTFVKRYSVGDGGDDDDVIPRIVSRGLKVAAVTLSRIK